MRALQTHAPLLLYYKSSRNVKTSPFSHKNFLFGPRAAVSWARPTYTGRVGAGNITHPINVWGPRVLTAWGMPSGRVTLNMQRLNDPGPRSLHFIHRLRHWTLPQTRWDWLPVQAIPSRRGKFPQSGSAGAGEKEEWVRGRRRQRARPPSAPKQGAWREEGTAEGKEQTFRATWPGSLDWILLMFQFRGRITELTDWEDKTGTKDIGVFQDRFSKVGSTEQSCWPFLCVWHILLIYFPKKWASLCSHQQ